MACSLLGELREFTKLVVAWWRVQILRHSADKFSFRNGSIGNFFFAGARIFFQSLDAAIFLDSRVSHIPTHSSVLPAICTNDRLTLGCELQDGTLIKGQNAISHPTVKNAKCRTSVIKASSPLPSPIKRIFYISSEGNNIFHEVLRGVGETIAARSCLKVLILNGTHDRETAGMFASQYVSSIADALNRKFCDSMEVQHCEDPYPSLDHSVSCGQSA